MLILTTVSISGELEQILALQRINLERNIDEMEVQTQGFVTLVHDLASLQQMHSLSPSVIAKDDEKVVGYALVMPPECRQIVPALEPMFKNFDNLKFQNRAVSDYKFYVMGQVCVDKQYRGTGLFDRLYQKHKELHSRRYDFVITEVSTRNLRSVRAHERVGFQTLNIYRDELDEWAVILWDWR